MKTKKNYNIDGIGSFQKTMDQKKLYVTCKINTYPVFNQIYLMSFQMMKRSSVAAREENYEHVLMCLICRSLFDDYDHQPKFLPCHHTFCKDCLREYVKQMGDEIECPSCRKIANIPAAGVAALQTNFYVKYIQSLVCGSGGITCSIKECGRHESQQPQFYCQTCQTAICKLCCSKEEVKSCHQHSKVPLTTATEESHQNLDSAFSKANATIEAKKVLLENMLRNLSEEKDQALRKIDSTFEGHVHTLHRRATLIKNKVIDIFKENVDKLENDLLEISTALTCIVSLKDYHENKISHGDFREITKGIEEIDEVNGNITKRVKPQENHILFEEAHGADKFKSNIKDLGRVRCTRPMVPRTEPEGAGAGAGASSGVNVLTPKDKSPLSDDSKPCTPCNDVGSLTSLGEESMGGEQGNTSVSSPHVCDEKTDAVEQPLSVPTSDEGTSQQPQPTSQTLTDTSREDYINGTLSSNTTVGPSAGVGSATTEKERVASFVPNQSQSVTTSGTAESKKQDDTSVSLAMSSSMTSNPEESHTPSHKSAKSHKGTKVKGGPPRIYSKDGTKPKDSKSKDQSQNKSKDSGKNTKDSGKKVKNVKSDICTAPPQITSPPDPKPVPCVVTASPRDLSTGPLVPPCVVAAVLEQHAKSEPCHNGTGYTDVERLKMEKEYYHMVYTSYDEEELLRELKCGKANLDCNMKVGLIAEESDLKTNKEEIEVKSGKAGMDDSDSWLTISSGDECQSLLVDEAVVDNEQTTF